MSDTTAALRRKIASAGDLRSVVRTMKALAASNIGQYEAAVRALADYARTVELGLTVCLRDRQPGHVARAGRIADVVVAVVFGSDQGLVGRFNEVITEHTIQALGAASGTARVWSVGERVHGRLADAGVLSNGVFPVPTSVKAIAPLVSQILIETEVRHGENEILELYLFYNRPMSGAAYSPVRLRLLPLDEQWRRDLAGHDWPTRNLPQVVGGRLVTLRALIREYLFVSLFRACAESLASENASRLASMRRADRNIDDILGRLNGTLHRVRQSGIDAELFDVIAGFEMLGGSSKH